MTIEGGCRCGAVRYTLALDAPPAIYACHCLHCQTWSSSAFAEHALLPETVMTVAGPIEAYDPGGAGSVQRVCGTCHTRLFNSNPAIPGMIVLRASTLDESDRIAPMAHIWTRRKQPWLTLPADVPQWPESPAPEDFAASAARAGIEREG